MDDVSPLEADIRQRIAVAGPMPVHEYMTLCLSDPRYGYYVTHDPLGARGDFITAPEVSQMFGELIGIWMAAVWKKMGSPDKINIIELGPGRGTLMKDALRALQVMRGFRETISLQLVEISPILRAQQQRALQGGSVPTAWHASLKDVPEGPSIIVANEFFDALPIHQVVKTASGWHERRIAIDAAGQLAFTLASDPIPHFEKLLPPALRAADEGAIFEWRGDTVALEIGLRVSRDGGAALVIDYGHVESDFGDTLQAVGRHAYADPLASAGNLDLSAHVDFQALARSVNAMGVQSFGPLAQGEFLSRLGIDTRATALKAKAAPDIAKEIESAILRLTAHGRTSMGTFFKVMAFAHRSLGVPPAFDG